jgi:quercetin dioxygenase-like cupin family protein
MQPNPPVTSTPERTLDLSPIGAKFIIRKTAVETGDRSFEMEMVLLPHSGGTPLHIHPHAVEEYQVLEGTFEVNVAGVWKTAGVGERIVIDKGVPHTFRNTGDQSVRIDNVHRPAMKFEEYFRRLHRLANSGVIKSQKMTPKALLHLSMLMASYPDEIRSVQPPQMMVRGLAAIGRMLGYRI